MPSLCDTINHESGNPPQRMRDKTFHLYFLSIPLEAKEKRPKWVKKKGQKTRKNVFFPCRGIR